MQITKGGTPPTLWRSIRFVTYISCALLASLGIYYGITTGNFMQTATLVGLTTALAVLEVGLSADNAVVNARKLTTMKPFWQILFLTVGIFVAVFVVRFALPIEIVAWYGNLSFIEAARLAFTDGERYGEILHGAHAQIAGFGGMFLAMVFLSFFFSKQERTWLGWIEQPLQRLSALMRTASVTGIAIGLALAVPLLAPAEQYASVRQAMFLGLGVFVAIHLLGKIAEKLEKLLSASGIVGLLYLEVLDASFSFDGVVGAFAITSLVPIIVVGLGIGALYVRSLTVYLVRTNKLETLPYLEHAAHYAIGSLATVMFLGMAFEIPEYLTAGCSIGLLCLGIVSSRRVTRGSVQAVSVTTR